ncbi:MAG: dienelactone hydrolase family protein [Actinobacteria bacterium]|nr:dienelactone hydrolase family protein [Actinomycetota bacterium]
MPAARAFVALGMALGALGLVVGLRGEIALATRTASVLASVIPGHPPTPLDAAPVPHVRTVTYATSEGLPVVADLYVPSGVQESPAIILFVGVIEGGRRYANLVTLADGFARAGFTVLAPDSLAFEEYRVVPADVDALVAGFRFLAAQPAVNPRRIGFIGFCMGGALALVAASDPRIADEVALVATIGTFYSLDSMLDTLTTNVATTFGVARPYTPHPFVWGVARNTLLAQLTVAGDRQLLANIFGGDGPTPDTAALAQDDLTALSPAGRAVFELFMNRDHARSGRLLAELRLRLPGALEAISPERHVANLRAPVRLLHDRGDTYVPVGESERLLGQLGGPPRATLTTLDILRHAELTAPDLASNTLLQTYAPGFFALVRFAADALRRL